MTRLSRTCHAPWYRTIIARIAFSCMSPCPSWVSSALLADLLLGLCAQPALV